MQTEMIDLSSQPLPLRLLRVQQLRDRAAEPLILDEFAPTLEGPRTSDSQRAASTERLLHARRRERTAAEAGDSRTLEHA